MKELVQAYHAAVGKEDIANRLAKEAIETARTASREVQRAKEAIDKAMASLFGDGWVTLLLIQSPEELAAIKKREEKEQQK